MSDLIDVDEQQYIVGKTHNVYSVVYVFNDDYAVDKPFNKEFDKKVINIEQKECSCTQFKHNPSCTHIEAVQTHLLLKGTRFLNQSDAVYEIDHDETQLVVTRSGDLYNIIFTDGSVGYVNRRFKITKNNVVCQDRVAKEKANSNDLYRYWETQSVYDRHVDSSVKFEGYLHHSTNLDEKQVKEFVDLIEDNEGDLL